MNWREEVNLNQIASYEAGIRKLETTLRRQEDAAAATRAQVEMFRERLEAAGKARDEAIHGRPGGGKPAAVK